MHTEPSSPHSCRARPLLLILGIATVATLLHSAAPFLSEAVESSGGDRAVGNSSDGKRADSGAIGEAADSEAVGEAGRRPACAREAWSSCIIRLLCNSASLEPCTRIVLVPWTQRSVFSPSWLLAAQEPVPPQCGRVN